MIQWFLTLLVAGLMLIGAEVFVPGGVLGAIGAMALMTAATMGFIIFPPAVATMIALAMIVMVGIVVALWIKLFPHTSIGRQMTDLRDLKDVNSTDSTLTGLVGKIGISRSALRPAGIIEIENRRIDVVTAGEMIDSNTPVRVRAVEGPRVIVEALPPAVD